MVAWVLMSSIAAGSKIILTVGATAANWTDYHTLFVNGAVPTYEAAQIGVAAQDAASTTSLTTTAWAHVAAVGISAISRNCYVNGAGVGTNTTANTPVAGSINSTVIGGLQIGVGTFLDFNGVIAFPAIWDIALSVPDLLSLTAGLSPRQMHPESLRSYCRLDGNGPEQDLVSGTGYAVTGTPTVTANPRIYGP
jgi:hypothetical protein